MFSVPSLGGQGFPGGSDSKESACNAGDLSLIPGSGRSPGEGNGYPLQYSWDFPGGSDGKESACRKPRFDPWVGKIPRRREWLPTPVFFIGRFQIIYSSFLLTRVRKGILPILFTVVFPSV